MQIDLYFADIYTLRLSTCHHVQIYSVLLSFFPLLFSESCLAKFIHLETMLNVLTYYLTYSLVDVQRYM